MPQWRQGDVEGGVETPHYTPKPPQPPNSPVESRQQKNGHIQPTRDSSEANATEAIRFNGEIGIEDRQPLREETRTSGTFNDLLPTANIPTRSNGYSMPTASMVSRMSTHIGVGGGISFRSPRVMGLIMASPFLLCFLLFGVINITAGTLITLASIHTKDERATVDTMPNVISPGNIIDSTANTSAVAVLLRPTVKPTDRSLLLKSREQRGTIDARRLVGIVLLFTGTTLICIGGGIGYVACRSVTSSSSISTAANKNNSKCGQSYFAERETAIGTQTGRQPSLLTSSPPAEIHTGLVGVTCTTGLSQPDPQVALDSSRSRQQSTCTITGL